MDEALAAWIGVLSWPLLTALIVLSIALLGKGADWLVEEAVALSRRSGLPKIIIGATIVSLGTTTPEAVVSVLSSVQGKPGLALGNAVGSIICDTGLILGLACLISPPILDPAIVNRQGWIQFAAGWLLVVASFPWLAPQSVFQQGGNLSQVLGLTFLALLLIYFWVSIRWARDTSHAEEDPSLRSNDHSERSALVLILRLTAAIFVVVAASWILIPAVSDAAKRLSVPESIVAATLVALGTSLPELVTAISAARRGHSELALGNVVGADILNVLFVAGASAAVTQEGLAAPSHFFWLYFPSMLFVLTVFRIGILTSPKRLGRPFGVGLLVTYLAVLAVTHLSYLKP